MFDRKEYAKKYRENHRALLAQKQREYHRKNLDAISETKRKYYQKNREHIREYGKRYIVENREKYYAQKKIHRAENLEARLEYEKQYRVKNRERILTRMKNVRKNNVQVRLASNLRIRLGDVLRGKIKRGSAVHDLGCTIAELKMYIEGQFKDGMTWENWTRIDLHEKAWNIDHKIPLAFFDLTDRGQLLKACHYSNLQPMWAKENLSKHTKIYES